LCGDNDKARYNAVRAVGNLLRYIPPQAYASGRLKLDIESGLHAIVKNIATGSVKVRWNACYAIANVFQNDELHSQLELHLSEVFASLTSTLRSSRNFKVRISAATAIAAPQDRRLYGMSDTYLIVWQSLVDVLGCLDDLDADFVEYKYRDTLIDQVCATLVHMTRLMNLDDVILLDRLVNDKFDVLSMHVRKYVRTIADQQAQDAVVACLAHLSKLTLQCQQNDGTLTLESVTVTSGSRATAVLEQLSNLLSATQPGDVAGDGVGLTSGFRQMYD
jgi:hypothetical protein